MAQGWQRLRTELAHLRSARSQLGTLPALLRRARRALDLEEVTRGRVDFMSEQISTLDGQLRLEADQLVELRADLQSEIERATDSLSDEVEGVTARVFTSERIFAVTSWVDAATVSPDVLVSVVLPTLGRRHELLVRAVESVKSQAYPNWELLVVVPDPSLLGELGEDERIRVLVTDQDGVSAARNRALDAARGELIAYCDDDNLMASLWLKAVVWAARVHPDADVFYGAQIVESPERVPSPTEPAVMFGPFERRSLLEMNCIDQGALAHRRALPEARFDETLDACVDWDLVIRLTSTHAAVPIPVVSSYYSTTAPDRLSMRENPGALVREVRRRARAASPLRVLAYNSMFPLISEAYIGDELEALVQHGAEVAGCVAYPRSAPMPWNHPLYFDLDRAVREFEPDVVLVYWTVFAEECLGELEALGIPFALRVHSFDARPEVVRELQASSACCGVWAYPPLAEELAGVHALPALFTSHDMLPPPAQQRDLVMSVSAGLPKKDWDVLLDAFSRLPELDRRIVTGLTEAHTTLPTTLVERVQQHQRPPLVQVNLTRDQVFALLARTAAFVYTLVPEARFGNPMSIAEAMCAGACIVAPDRPEARALIGDGFRGYRTATDIVGHVHEIVAGGAAIDAEREANRRRGFEQFCDPTHAKRFSSELTDAVADWYVSPRP